MLYYKYDNLHFKFATKWPFKSSIKAHRVKREGKIERNRYDIYYMYVDGKEMDINHRELCKDSKVCSFE